MAAKRKVVAIRPRLLKHHRLGGTHGDRLQAMADAVKTGEVVAYVAIAIRPGYGMWITRSRMTPADRMQLVAQLEYAKYLILKDDDEEDR